MKLIFNLLLLFLAAAQSTDPPAKPPRDLLRGPDVTATERAGKLEMMSTSEQRRMLQRQAVPAQRWFKELAVLPISSETRRVFESMRADFKAATKLWQKKNAEVQRAIRQNIQQVSGRVVNGEEERRKRDARIIELREALEILQASAPQVLGLQKACWAMLPEETQLIFSQRLTAVRESIRAERARREAERQRLEEAANLPMMQDQ